MKDSAGFYTGELQSYGILDDSEKSKDFYLVGVHFKQQRPDQYTPLRCDGLLLNFEDVISIQVVKIEPDENGQLQVVPQTPEPPQADTVSEIGQEESDSQ